MARDDFRPLMEPKAPRHGVSACVVNYQGERYLETTLNALHAARAVIDEVLVVDSASTDRSRELVRERFPNVRLITLEVNRGPAVARNRGFEAASHDRLLFVDNDVVLGEGCAERLISAVNDYEDVVLTLPRVRLAACPELIQFEGAESHFMGLMSLRRSGEPVNRRDGRGCFVGSMVSACFVLARDRWGREPPFDETFEFNYEDHDFGMRCSVMGHRILTVPEAECFHGAGTEGYSVRETNDSPPGRSFNLIRGRWMILSKSFQLRTLAVLAPAFAVYEVVQLAFVVKRGLFGEWLRAVWWMVSRPGEVLRKRRAVQRRRRCPDRAVLVGGPLPLRRGVLTTRMERLSLDLLQWTCDCYWRVARRVI